MNKNDNFVKFSPSQSLNSAMEAKVPRTNIHKVPKSSLVLTIQLCINIIIIQNASLITFNITNQFNSNNNQLKRLT